MDKDDDVAAITLRMPKELKMLIQAKARLEKRSMNNFILRSVIDKINPPESPPLDGAFSPSSKLEAKEVI